MKYVINNNYGGYEVPEEVQKLTGLKTWDASDEARTNQVFIDWVMKHQNDPECDLCVVEVPEEATDTYLYDYDGVETMLVVINGKIEVAPCLMEESFYA